MTLQITPSHFDPQIGEQQLCSAIWKHEAPAPSSVATPYLGRTLSYWPPRGTLRGYPRCTCWSRWKKLFQLTSIRCSAFVWRVQRNRDASGTEIMITSCRRGSWPFYTSQPSLQVSGIVRQITWVALTWGIPVLFGQQKYTRVCEAANSIHRKKWAFIDLMKSQRGTLCLFACHRVLVPCIVSLLLVYSSFTVCC